MMRRRRKNSRLLIAWASARFVDPTGREGTITRLRHKYVARLQYLFEMNPISLRRLAPQAVQALWVKNSSPEEHDKQLTRRG
jgi:hypothetical protein